MMMVGFENVVRQTFAVWDFKSAPFEKPSSPEKKLSSKGNFLFVTSFQSWDELAQRWPLCHPPSSK